MNNPMPMIRVLLVGIGLVVMTAMWCIIQEQNNQPPQIVYIIDPNFIPSAKEIQQRLKETGNPRYDPGKIDGVPGPITIKAWDNHTCDQFAKKCFEKN